MIDLLSVIQSSLQNADYRTRLVSSERSPVVCFEDDSLLGFGCIFADPQELLAKWREMETALLARYAAGFRRAGDKAWNVYMVFACGTKGDAMETRQIRWIEEDLERTRKIAAIDLATREDVIRALLPLLPLQYRPMLRPEDAAERLKSRIQNIAPAITQVLLDPAVSTDEVLKTLRGSL